MSKLEPSKANLKAHIEALQRQVAQQKRNTEKARAEADRLRLALRTQPYAAFTVTVDVNGDIQHVRVEEDAPGAVAPRKLLADPEAARQCQRALQNAHPITFRTSFPTDDGMEAWSVVLAPDHKPAPGGDGQTEPRVLRGIACRAWAPADVRAEDSKKAGVFDRAFHLGPAALLLVRLEDGVVLDASERFLDIIGYQAEAFIGTSLADLDLWVDADERQHLVEQLLDARTIRDQEFQIRRRDGSVRTVLGSARCVERKGCCCLMGSIIDITERKASAAAERESQRLLQKIFHASPAPIFISRLRDGQFMNVNAAMCRLVGAEPDDLLDRCCGEVDIWETPDLPAVLDEKLRAESGTYEGEVVLRTKDGEHVTVLASCQRIRVEGEPCALTVMTDITSRKKTEKALIRAKEQAEEIAQFRSALFTNLTHEVRTPLTVILGFTSILEKGVSERYRRFIHLIERSGRRLMLTLDSLLDLAQLEAGTLDVNCEVHDLVDVVHGAAQPMEVRAKRQSLDFQLDLPDTQALASIDHGLFTRALSHLIDNALKFTEEGTVTVAIDVEDGKTYTHVRDTGRGINDAFVEQAFDAFSQESEGLDRSHQGSGLGLTVAKRLIEQLGGTIHVETREGKGSVFTIMLPRVVPAEDGNGT